MSAIPLRGPLSYWESDTGHRAIEHINCTRDHCSICEGGLTFCSRCGAMEGALLPKCPGVQQTMAQMDEAYQQYCSYEGPFVGSQWHPRSRMNPESSDS